MGFLQDINNLQKQAEAMPPFQALGQQVAADQRDAVATIVAVRNTGATVAGDPTVELDLLVSVDGADPYAVTHRQTISRIAHPSFQPGATIPVRVDPSDRSSLLIG